MREAVAYLYQYIGFVPFYVGNTAEEHCGVSKSIIAFLGTRVECVA